MAKGVTIDLIVDPKGAVDGISVASGESNKFTGLLADLGKLGASAVAAVATAAVAAAGALAAATVSAGKYADEILQASTNTNISTDTLQAYKYAAEQMDVSFDTFISSQGKFTKSMAGATEGTGPAAEAFSALGLSVTDSAGNLVDSETLYWQAIDALGGVTNETERTALAQQLFGKTGAEMNSIIAQGSAGFAELSAQAQANGAIMSGEQLEKLGAFDDKMEALTSTVDAAKNALGLTLLPILDELAGSGTSALGQFTSALLDADGDISKAGPAFQTLGSNIASALTSAIPKILEVGTALVMGLVNGIVKSAPSLIETAIPLVVSFVSSILSMLPRIIDAGLQVLVALIQGIATAIPQLIPVALQAILGIVNALIANLPLLLDAALQLITGLGQGLIAAIPTLLAALPTIIISLVTFLIGAIPQIIQAGIELFIALIGALPQIIDTIVAALPQIIVAVVVALVAAIPQLIEAGIKLFIALIQALPQIISSIIQAVPKIITGLVQAFTNPAVLGQIGSAGVALMQGFINGITSMIGAVGNAIGGVMDFVAGFFPHSPAEHGPFSGSGWTGLQKSGLAIGAQFTSGLETGFEGANSLIAGMSGQFASDVTIAASARANVEATGGVAGGGGVTLIFQSLVPDAAGGRAVVAALGEYVRTGGTGLKAVLGNG